MPSDTVAGLPPLASGQPPFNVSHYEEDDTDELSPAPPLSGPVDNQLRRLTRGGSAFRSSTF